MKFRDLIAVCESIGPVEEKEYLKQEKLKL
jgi:hypothetical protein